MSLLRVPLPVTGRYEVYLGIRSGTCYAHLKSRHEDNHYPFLAHAGRVEFQDKAHKEVYWKAIELREESAIEISPLPLTVREPKVHPFGSIRYLKLVPLTVRIPAGDVTYFRVFERLARAGIVQCVVPSGLFQREPWYSLTPYLKWQDYGCRVYGIIDGWLTHVGSFNNFQLSLSRNPADIRADINHYLDGGADGIFGFFGHNYQPKLQWMLRLRIAP